jgi:hypothetical protein
MWYLSDGTPARCGADHLTDVVDFAVAIRALAEHDVRQLEAADVVRAHRQRHHVERDAERFDVLAEARERLDRPLLVESNGRQAAADVIDAEAGQHAQDGVGVAVLRADFHQRAHGRRCGGLRSRAERRDEQRCREKMSAIHICLARTLHHHGGHRHEQRTPIFSLTKKDP